ncbi:MAG: methylmalonyl Co-A mutase-associated GTPase MeaB [Microthrixaceae bacterium]
MDSSGARAAPIPATPHSVEGYVSGVLSGDRAVLARTITLLESRNPAHRQVAAEVLARLLPHTGSAVRVGITGVPGVGKSTFIDQLGVNLTASGHRVAVLAVDPTSSRSGGSILGDKTRMARLAVDPNAFIRPSPAGATLGGVTRATRETILVCEAAGFDVVLVETVGVGQSETVVASMVDFFLVLMLTGAGDSLQGIKKGVIEMADMIAVNKADGANRERASMAAADYRAALHLLKPASETWSPPVLMCSGLENEGMAELWEQIELHRTKMSATNELQDRRSDQQVRWMRSMIDDRLRDDLGARPEMTGVLHDLERQVHAGSITASAAVDQVWERFLELRC